MAVLPGPVVDADWLAAHLAAPGRDELVVGDVRWYLDGRSGAAAYEQGHLPGAVFVDLDGCLAGPPSAGAGRHPLPDPDTFAGCMSAAGIGDATAVVAYDDQGGATAARLVWMLRATGGEAALLDGGLAAWPGRLDTGPVHAEPASFTAAPWPAARLADADDVARALADGSAIVVDARAPERYRGETEPVDPRAGHVPGAVNVPFAGNLDPATGRVLDPAALGERFAAAGIGPEDDVIVYCGSGVTACHDLLALEAAGLGPGRLYAGSWSQWSADPERPVTVGDRP